MNHVQLDAKNILCPLPVIKTQNRVKQLTVGDRLTVVCTDPGVLEDIPAWCRINGHQVIETSSGNYEYSITLEVGG